MEAVEDSKLELDFEGDYEADLEVTLADPELVLLVGGITHYFMPLKDCYTEQILEHSRSSLSGIDCFLVLPQESHHNA